MVVPALAGGLGRCGLKTSPSRQVRQAREVKLGLKAVSTNGTVNGIEVAKAPPSTQPQVEMLEMVVADDLRPQSGAAPAARQPTKRLVPAPHKVAPGLPGSGASPTDLAPTMPEQPLNGRRSNGDSGSALLPPAAVQQLMAQQASSKAMSMQLSLAQRQVREQALELKDVRHELSKREAEVVSLKQQLAERDGKLKAARTDALEARMALQQKDAELKAAFAQLSEAVHERSVMRAQLAQTHAELAETRAELEQLADDILAIKLLMDDDEFGNGDSSADCSTAGEDGYSFPAAATAAGAAADDEALDILQSLAELSRQLVEDASEDDAILESWAATLAPSSGGGALNA